MLVGESRNFSCYLRIDRRKEASLQEGEALPSLRGPPLEQSSTSGQKEAKTTHWAPHASVPLLSAPAPPFCGELFLCLLTSEICLPLSPTARLKECTT